MEDEKKSPKYVSRVFLLSTFEWLQIFCFALAVVALLLAFALRMVGVEGDSMKPTLQDGDRLVLSAVTEEYTYGDIVVIDRYTDDPLIKRVVAVAGDTVEITDDCRLCVNGVVQTEDYIMGQTVRRDMREPIVVPEGYVFVLGDNRTWSKDSRMKEIGPVSVKDIVGKVVYRVWPIGALGDVYDDK